MFWADKKAMTETSCMQYNMIYFNVTMFVASLCMCLQDFARCNLCFYMHCEALCQCFLHQDLGLTNLQLKYNNLNVDTP